MTLADRILATGLLQRPEGATAPEIVEGLRAEGVVSHGAVAAAVEAMYDDDQVEPEIADPAALYPFAKRDGWPVWVAPGRQP